MRSEELAIFLERLMIEGKSKIDFIMGARWAGERINK